MVAKNKIVEKKQCKLCSKEKLLSKTNARFFKSNSKFDPDGYISICKDCINENVDVNNIDSVTNMLLQLNKPFLVSGWESAKEEIRERGWSNEALFGVYLKIVNLNGKDLTWKDSEFFDEKKENKVSGVIDDIDVEDVNGKLVNEDKNKEDVLRMLGYDPFEYENLNDKRHLYNKLVDFLDESTLEDSFKLPAVIEIVKTFNQLDKLNSALATITADAITVAQNVGNIKSLTDAKDKMLKSVLALAKDNGISVNNNNNKSKGAGTLSGIIKNLQEKGFTEADINIFDIETAEGMRQVADISHRSILNQLQFDENDYADILAQQREMIVELRDKLEKLEEENRLLKIRMKSVYKDVE